MDACVDGARVRIEGVMVERDLWGALARLWVACGPGRHRVCVQAANLLIQLRALPAERDMLRTRGIALATAECDARPGDSCLDASGDPLERARQACEAGSADGCDREAELSVTEGAGQGDHDNRDAARERARALRSKACDGGDPDACEDLETNRSRHRAAQILKTRCASGRAEACESAAGLVRSKAQRQQMLSDAQRLYSTQCDADRAHACYLAAKSAFELDRRSESGKHLMARRLSPPLTPPPDRSPGQSWDPRPNNGLPPTIYEPRSTMTSSRDAPIGTVNPVVPRLRPVQHRHGRPAQTPLPPEHACADVARGGQRSAEARLEDPACRVATQPERLVTPGAGAPASGPPRRGGRRVGASAHRRCGRQAG